MRGTNVACEIRAIFHFRAPLNKCAGSSREERVREKGNEGWRERRDVGRFLPFADLPRKFSDQFMCHGGTRVVKLLPQDFEKN